MTLQVQAFIGYGFQISIEDLDFDQIETFLYQRKQNDKFQTVYHGSAYTGDENLVLCIKESVAVCDPDMMLNWRNRRSAEYFKQVNYEEWDKLLKDFAKQFELPEDEVNIGWHLCCQVS